MKRVVLESPYAGDIYKNIMYAKSAIKDCLKRGESPIASHLLLTQPGILDDENQDDRKLGISAGHTWINACDCVAVYSDLGVSTGMKQGIAYAEELGIPVEYRYLRRKLNNE